MKIEFRKLRADEIDCRIGQIKDSGLSLLLYKDARCDMNVLDEAVGALNWKREHTRDNRNCIVSIWDEDKKEWVSKEDTGTESNTEAEKGLASDSFKRACVNWGIGKCNIEVMGGKPKCFDKFKVVKLTYAANGDIENLAIANEKTGKVVFLKVAKEEKKND